MDREAQLGEERAVEARNVTNNRRVKRFALRALHQSSSRQVARMISANTGVVTPSSSPWRRQHEAAQVGQRMLGQMIFNIENGVPIDNGIHFAPAPGMGNRGFRMF